MKSRSQFHRLMRLGLGSLTFFCLVGQGAVAALANLPNNPHEVFDLSMEYAERSRLSLQKQSVPESATEENPSVHDSKGSAIPEHILNSLAVEGLWVIQPDLPSLGQASDYLPLDDFFLAPVVGDDYLLLDLSDRRVYVYKNRQEQASYPVAIGRKEWETPTGIFAVMRMERYPIWKNPWTGEIIPAGPDNPLGVAWIGFWSDGQGEIGFHGTPNPNLLGQAVSHGCVRMHNRDVVRLYQQVTIGMPVQVVD